MSKKTVQKYVAMLEDKQLITTEPTTMRRQDGRKQNGNLLYTIIPMHAVTQAYYQRQFEKADLAAAQQKAKAEKLDIEFIPAGDEQSA